MIISLVATSLKRLGVACLAFVILWHVTRLGTPPRGRAMVHVGSTDDVLVWVDHDLFRIRSAADTPVVCELEPGGHVAQVWRHGKLEGEEHFLIEPGQDVVIGPIDRPHSRTDAAAERAVPASEAIGPAGLTAHVHRSTPTAVAY